MLKTIFGDKTVSNPNKFQLSVTFQSQQKSLHVLITRQHGTTKR